MEINEKIKKLKSELKAFELMHEDIENEYASEFAAAEYAEDLLSDIDEKIYKVKVKITRLKLDKEK